MKCKVLSNLKRDGVNYIPGDTIEISEEDGERLVKDGVLEAVKVKKEIKPEKEVKARKGKKNRK